MDLSNGNPGASRNKDSVCWFSFDDTNSPRRAETARPQWLALVAGTGA
jgi:hypothetical protein